MSDLIDDPRVGENAHEFTVTEISGAVKRSLEAEFGRVRVKGEVSRVVRARSGHLYFDVKDDRNSLACTSWKGQISKLSVLPEEGMEVVVTGKMTAFGGQSKYNLNVDDVAVAGVGALMAMLEKRKQVLATEGLFDPSNKKDLPFLPEVIGVVTSPTGAVIRDILHRLRDRFPRKVLVWPVAVQGAKCAPEVAGAIDGFNALTPGGALPRPDLIIVARGGGAIEDLWGFNEEIVARAAAASDIPLISAVGHETDTTLIDFVSDCRAPTPTAAAELAVPVRLDLLAHIGSMSARASLAQANSLTRREQRLVDLARVLPKPENLIYHAQQRFDAWDGRLPSALQSLVQRQELRLRTMSSLVKPSALNRIVILEKRRLEALTNRFLPALSRIKIETRQKLNITCTRLWLVPFVTRSNGMYAKLDQNCLRLNQNLTRQIEDKKKQLNGIDRLRETLGYRETLRRGYSVVRDGVDVITSVVQAKSAKFLEVEFVDGRVSVGESFSLAMPTGSGKRRKPKPPEQGELL